MQYHPEACPGPQDSHYLFERFRRRLMESGKDIRPMPEAHAIMQRHRILIIGAGPIVIGQACEFDYSGAQACKALKDEGYRIVLVNSNPATIMTDPDLADATYIEPITPRDRRADHRARAARCAAADHGRPDRAQHRDGAAALGRAASATASS